MIRMLNRRLFSRHGEEDGIALALVIGLCAVMTVLITTAITFSVSTTSKANTDTNSSAAMDAAYAGVSDYQARLTNDNTYQRYGNPAAPFSVATGSTTLVLPPVQANGDPGNAALGIGASGTWATVPGSTATYRYEVDNSQYASKGMIRIRSTGRSGTQTKTVIANIRQKGFLDYLYFTDYEVQDPALTGKSQSLCERYYPTRVDGDCGGAIQFGSSETVNGPLHSNDAIYICGGTFNGPVTSNYATAPYYRNCGSASFTQGVPTYAPKLTMPPTNSAMKNETRGDLTASDVPRPGCLYTGPTTIKFNADGTMTVRSPWTRWTNTSATAGMETAPVAGACGTPGTSGLASAAGQTIQVPAQNLIYVQTVPSVSTDPNYWAPTAVPYTGFSCPASGNGLGYPLSKAVVSGGTTTTTTETILSSKAGDYYGCRTGDVFTQGTVKGQVTVAAENYVWITGDLVYSDPAADVLGLVGQNAVWVWNPYGTTKACTSSSCGSTKSGTLLTDTDRTIDAAILSVSHTFQVQNYDQGSARGDLNVLGAIAQKFRGTVGTTAPTGYLKKYSYDVRFRNIAPPKFLQAVSTTYGITQVAEVKAAYLPSGATAP